MLPEPRRILLIKPSALGDIVHALPTLRLLRRRYPKAQIAWLVNPAFADLLRGVSALDEVFLFPRHQWSALPEAVRTLRAFEPDWTIDLQGLLRTGLLTAASGASTRIGFKYAREGAHFAYNRPVAGRGPNRHAVERYLDVAEELGCGRGPVEFDLPHESMELPPAPYAVLVPGTNWPTKRWPIAHFAELAERLRAERIFTVAAGAPHERGLADQVGADRNLAGATTLRQMVSLLAGAALAVTNDSGPMHLAAALGTPLLAPFGPTDPRLTGPYGRLEDVVRRPLPCSPCLRRHCVHQTCLQQVPASALIPLATSRLRRRVGP